MRALPLLCVAVSGLQPSSRRQFVAGATSTALAPAAAAARDLQFKDLGDGLTVAQITEGRGDAVVRKDSVVLVELVGRLVGKQGWTFEDSREDKSTREKLEEKGQRLGKNVKKIGIWF